MTLRKRPEDFRVTERLVPSAVAAMRPVAERGRCLVVELSKTSLTTAEAVGRVAKVWGVPVGAVSPCGQKDKHAVTTQFVSVGWPGERVVPESIETPTMSARAVGWLDVPLDAAAIACNRFELVVRDLDRRGCVLMEDHAAVLVGADGESLVVMNYFGDQRFGSARHGGGFAARALIDGDYAGALKLLVGTPARKDTGSRRALTRAAATHWGDWAAILAATTPHPDRRAIEALAVHPDFRAAFLSLPHATQQWCVEGYQSWLWNDIVRRLVRSLGLPSDRVFAAEDEYGELVFPAGAKVPEAWMRAEVAMPAAGARYAAFVRPAVEATVAAQGLTLERLAIEGVRRPRFESSDRPLVVRVSRVDLGRVEADELASPRSPARWKRRVSFELPRGAYATVVMRALGQ